MMGLDAAGQVSYAESHGIPQGTWLSIVNAWNARMTANQALMQRFNQLYRELLAKGRAG